MGQGEGEGKEKIIIFAPPPTPRPHLASAPILYRSTIQDGGIENPIYYLAFRSKITPALQAKRKAYSHMLILFSVWFPFFIVALLPASLRMI